MNLRTDRSVLEGEDSMQHVLDFAIPKGAFALPIEEEPGRHPSASAPYVDRRISGWWKMVAQPSQADDTGGNAISETEYAEAA